MNEIEKQLKSLILSKYKSIREFSNEISMPYSTLDSIFKRGVSNASITNIIKICRKLDISADKLGVGELQHCVSQSGSDLTLIEQKHIEKYRSLNESGKSKVDDYLRLVLSDAENIKFEPNFKGIKEYAEKMAQVVTPLMSTNKNTSK